MLRSLFSGVSGMKNNQIKMDVIGNNIANVNTTAFKSGRVRFQDILSQTIKNASSPTIEGRGGVNPRQVGLGMGIAGIDTITNSGSLQPTGRPLDCAIDGEGYFLVSNGIKTLYSRDGAFNFDSDFNIVNSDGLKLMGYAPQDMAVAKTSIATIGGLNWSTATADTDLTADTALTITVTDNSTTPATVTPTNFSFTATPAQKVSDIISAINASGTGVTASLEEGRGLVFKRAYNSNETVTFTGGSGNLPATMSTSDETWFDTSALVNLSIPPQHPTKSDVRINNFSIEADGVIKGVYEDGTIEKLGKIALAKFANPAGLTKLGGNNYTVSANSGTAEIGQAGAGGYGEVQQSTLEMSNVDLAGEFTDMIITSRAFQANSRTITTSDEMLQELLNLKR